MNLRKPSVLVLIGLSIVAAACDSGSGGGGGGGSTTPTTAAATSTSTVTAASTSSPLTTPATTAPASTSSTTAPVSTTTATSTIAPSTVPSTVGPTTPATIAADDWKTILEELDRRTVALYAAPDLNGIDAVCATVSDCATGLQAQLGDAITKGQHIQGQHPFQVIQILNASVTDAAAPAPKVAVVTFVIGADSPPPAQLVDASGNVIDTLSVTTTKMKGRFTLVETDDPALPWREVLAESLGPVE